MKLSTQKAIDRMTTEERLSRISKIIEEAADRELTIIEMSEIYHLACGSKIS